jgi:hypothetical protein
MWPVHFVGLAISACLFTSSPRPSYAANSSATLRATTPVRSLVHVWPCSAPLQPLLPLPFPAPPLLFIFCALLDLTFHHSLSCPISHFPPKFPFAFLTALCPSWHICCLDTGFECLPLLRLPSGGNVGIALYNYSVFSKEAQSTLTYLTFDYIFFFACHSYINREVMKNTYRQQNQPSAQVVFA